MDGLRLPAAIGIDPTDYETGWNIASSLIQAGRMQRALEVNEGLGANADLDWVAVGFRSALDVHRRAQSQRGETRLN